MANIQIRSIEPSTDGSATVKLDIMAVDNEGEVIPGYHREVQLDAAKLAAALALPKAADLVAEVKRLVREQVPEEWYEEALDSVVAANSAAVESAEAFNTKISDFGKALPFILKV